MPIQRLHSLEDPRIDVYRDLRRSTRTRRRGEFIVEGENVVRRLLQSDHATLSVLTSERRVESLQADLPPDVDVFVLDHAAVSEIVGYKFHSGVLAHGRAKPNPSLDDLAPALNEPAALVNVVVCVHIDNPDNLGTILRTASGLGAAMVIVGEGCADPYSRRTLRVSMGEAFRIPIRISEFLEADLRDLRDRWSFTLVATVLDPTAMELRSAAPPERTALLLGNEAHGLEARWRDLCPMLVRIPMANQVDSLNVAVACGICLHHFTGPGNPCN